MRGWPDGCANGVIDWEPPITDVEWNQTHETPAGSTVTVTAPVTPAQCTDQDCTYPHCVCENMHVSQMYP